MAALVLDVGSWYRAQRAAQSTADASALAAAQGLTDTNEATARCDLDYAEQERRGNRPGRRHRVLEPDGSVNDTVARQVTRPASRLLRKGLRNRIRERDRSRNARVRSTSGQCGTSAPIVVHYKHPLLHCTRNANPTCDPEFGVSTTLNLEDLHQPGGGDGSGAFGLINLNRLDDNGNVGAGVLAGWLTEGLDQDMPLGRYHSAPSANFNNSQFAAALDTVIGKEVLFPVYRKLTGPGSNAQYDIIAWVGFIIRSYDTSGSNGTLTGEFTRYVAEGLPVEHGGGPPDTGVHEIELVN